MITGAVRNLEPVIGLDVLGADQQAQSVEAVVDTGFNGYLTLPGDSLSGLQLSFAGHRRGRLADGTAILLDMYQAKVMWQGRLREVLVCQADGSSLVGMAMMEGSRLTMDVVEGGEVAIEAIP